MNFDLAFHRLILVEGTTLDLNRTDRGNWTGGAVGKGQLKGTKYGISAASYPALDIANLTLDEAKAIYLRDWWSALAPPEVPGAIIYQMWVFGVNAGVTSARKALQRAVGVHDDGVIGPQTLAAVHVTPVTDVLLRMSAQVIRYYTALNSWDTNGKGWMSRVAASLEDASTDS